MQNKEVNLTFNGKLFLKETLENVIISNTATLNLRDKFKYVTINLSCHL